MNKFTLAHGAGINDVIALFRDGHRRTRTGRVDGSAQFHITDNGVAIRTPDAELAGEIAQRVRERAVGNMVYSSKHGEEWWVIFTPES